MPQIGFQIRDDILCQIIRHHHCFRAAGGIIQQSLRAQHQIRIFQRGFAGAGHHLYISRPQSAQTDMKRNRHISGISPDCFSHRNAGLFHRPSDDKDFTSAFLCGHYFFLKTTISAAVFCHQTCDVILLQHRMIHFIGKRAKHCNDLPARQSGIFAQLQTFFHREYARNQAVAHRLVLRKNVQILASGCQQNFSFNLLHRLCTFLHGFKVNQVLIRLIMQL